MSTDPLHPTIAITGGIGSGKSIVASIVSRLGYHVYDTDSQARQLMDTTPAIIARIADEISHDAIIDGRIHRPTLASIVFNDPELLARLNTIVHAAVRSHFISWRASLPSATVFIESAILYESGFDDLADHVWLVTSPEELRITRVMRRNALTEPQVRARIASQAPIPLTPDTTILLNDDTTPLLPQILPLL
ncbi:MAG: dephospho-CoA kinase [Lachnoclostridium sp.]|nr:dephospho-CoA kinase [Lachnoclostridium sp.]